MSSARLPSGIPGVDLTTTEREVAADEAPPLPVNADLSAIGKPTPRIDGRAKVTGAARYTADVRLPGMLFAKILRSPHPHAKVVAVDTADAERCAGVVAVHAIERIRSAATLRDPSVEAPLRWPIVRYVGQPIAAVAAETPEAAAEALERIRVEFEVLAFVTDLEAARKPDAPPVFPGPTEQKATAGGPGAPPGLPQVGNVRGPKRGGPGDEPQGDVAAGFAAADVVVEADYRTQVQTHSALEPHGVVADWRPDGLTVYASTQGTASVREELAEVFDLPQSRIRVVTEFMGGGFGAKFGIGNFGVLATHLSRKAGRPVRLVLDRREEHLAVGNRPSSVQRLRIGAKRDGTLTAIHLASYGSGGVATGAGTAGPASNMYPAPNVLTEESDVFTNAGPAAAFRAPGHPQGCFALEQSIDELAEKLGIDPLALRDRIDVDRPGEFIDAAVRREERRIGAERFDWSRRKAPGSDHGPRKRGVGVAQAVWFKLVNLDSFCDVRLWKDGTVETFSAVQDIGGGIRTALAQVVAEELGLAPADVVVRIGDTAFPPGPSSGGSMTTGSLTPAARNAAAAVRAQLLAAVAPELKADAAQLEIRQGRVVVRGEPSRGLDWKQACDRLGAAEVTGHGKRSLDYGLAEKKKFGVESLGGVQFVEVEVDVETGVIRVERVVAAHDCGRPINPLAIESQVKGGILQGISYALYEDRILDHASGRMLNPNFEQYKILGAREAPEIEVALIESYAARSSTDASGIGEPATIPTSAAIANAVYNAIGVRIRELPMTPARVLAALAAAPGGKGSPR